MASIAHNFSLVQPGSAITPSALADIETITITIQNRKLVTQETVGPALGVSATLPTWLTVVNQVYTFTYELDQTNLDYPEDYVVLSISATDTGGGTYDFTRVASFTGTSTPTPEEGFSPYGTVAEADAYFNTTLYAPEWEAYSTANKTRALIMASDHIDQETYLGRRHWAWTTSSSDYSHRVWPRWFDGPYRYLYHQAPLDETTGIPNSIKRASFVQALFILKTQLTAGIDINARREMQTAGLTGMSQGRSSEGWDLSRTPNTALCRAALDILNPYLAHTVQIGYRP